MSNIGTSHKLPPAHLIICKHQEALVAAHIDEAKKIGWRVKVTADEASRLGLETLIPYDVTPDEETVFVKKFIRVLFSTREIKRKCTKCGHISKIPRGW